MGFSKACSQANLLMNEKDDIISGITDAAEAVSIIVKTGDVDKAMNKFNKKGQGKQ